MPRLVVHAVVHPTNAERVLLSVEDDAGGPVPLDADEIDIRLWASHQYPVLFVNPIPVAQLIPVTVAAAPLGYFYELRLGDPPVYNEDGEPQEAQPLESYAPAVYLITVDRGGSHGQATAIA